MIDQGSHVRLPSGREAIVDSEVQLDASMRHRVCRVRFRDTGEEAWLHLDDLTEVPPRLTTITGDQRDA